MGPAQADRALDDPNLALRLCHRRSRLFNALQMVPTSGALSAVASAVPRRRSISTRAEENARYSDQPANPADVKILRSATI